MTISITMTSSGAQQTSPSTLRDQLVAEATALSPGLTANLPASLIEDMASTAAGAVAVIDSAYVDTINSITPYGANEFILIQQGQQTGVVRGGSSNTSVYVTFSGTPGYVIPQGFLVSDGAYQYATQLTVAIASTGSSDSVYCLATQQGSWAVPANTVIETVTSVPSSVTVTVTNPLAGTPGSSEQSIEEYRANVLQSFSAVSQGMPATVRTELKKVSGVQSRLVSMRQSGSNWIVLCGGGDPYSVAGAIYRSVSHLPSLTGSVLSVENVTNANPGVVQTDHNHNFTTGQIAYLHDIVGVSGINNTPLTVTVIDPYRFSIGVDTTSLGTYVSGGTVTPVLRNETVAINDYPDTYSITYVNPPQQSVAMAVVWNTSSKNYISSATVASLGQAAIVSYVNSLEVGLPINLYEVQRTFQDAVSSVLPSQLITQLTISVSINGYAVSPSSGTGVIIGDTESYFYTTAASIVITQGG